MEILLEHISKGLILILALSLPCVLTAATIGLVVGILQAVTQVQEQTIAAAPKIIFVFLVLILGGSIMLNVTTTYVREAFTLAFDEIPRRDVHLLPPRIDDENTQRARAFFKQQVQSSRTSFDKVKNSDLSLQNEKGKAPMDVSGSGSGDPNSVSERMTLEKQRQ